METSLKSEKIAILGYGNQGRAQALNLRDQRYDVIVGCREGKGRELALQEGWSPLSLEAAAKAGTLVMFLIPDLEIPPLYAKFFEGSGLKTVGFSHGYAMTRLKPFPQIAHFLVAPKGAGVVLRKKFQEGGDIPGAFAVHPESDKTRKLAIQYAKAIGCGRTLLETSFQHEVEGDLFGEQTVLLGGLLMLLNESVRTLIQKGHSPQSAFLDTAFEAKLILDLMLEVGPKELANRVSRAALYGGYTRGRELINAEAAAKLDAIFERIRSGKFYEEFEKETREGFPVCRKAIVEWADSPLQKGFEELKRIG